MICALAIGRKGSSGFPKKNVLNILGRPLAAYPLIAASESKYVDQVFLSTDCDVLKSIGTEYGAAHIERPPELASNKALGEDAFVHGYERIKSMIDSSKKIEFLVLLMCNAPTINGKLIDEGIEKLRSDETADSAVSVSPYNMWSPIRARKLDKDGSLQPFVPFKSFIDQSKISCDRDSQGDVFFADMGVSVVRPHCLDDLASGLLPQKWMGQRILPIHNWGGLDIDHPWQVGMLEFWLREHDFKYAGMTERTPKV